MGLFELAVSALLATVLVIVINKFFRYNKVYTENYSLVCRAIDKGFILVLEKVTRTGFEEYYWTGEALTSSDINAKVYPTFEEAFGDSHLVMTYIIKNLK